MAGAGSSPPSGTGGWSRWKGTRTPPSATAPCAAKAWPSPNWPTIPDRVLHPLKKVGGKLSGKWERISWDEALDTIAEKFKAVIAEYGPESIVVGQGTGRDYESHLYRFANLLGTPNVLTAGHMCYVSRVASTLITVGSLPIGDYEGGPKANRHLGLQSSVDQSG